MLTNPHLGMKLGFCKKNLKVCPNQSPPTIHGCVQQLAGPQKVQEFLLTRGGLHDPSNIVLG